MIATKQFSHFDKLYDYYNKELFDGKLKDCMLNMNRRRGTHGSFTNNCWRNLNPEEVEGVHEISLNPESLIRPDKEWQGTLVHEMAHLWQRDFGTPSRNGYHNKEWANKMESLGLIPTDTGKPGGKKTGQNMTHYIKENGLFEQVYNKLGKKGLEYLPSDNLLDTGKKKSNSAVSKIKYTCPCGNKVWGRPGLSIICAGCQKEFEMEEN